MKLPLRLLVPAAIIGGAALAVRKVAVRETLDWEDVEKPGTLIDIDGYRVHYVEAGAGPPIVLVHGFGGSTYSYRLLMPALAADHRCVALDLKGFGYSERTAGENLSHAAQVAMLARFLDALGIERAVLVGHSMGGGVVQRFAASYPGRTEALVLVASVTGEEGAGRRRVGARATGLVRPLLPVFAGIAAGGLLRGAFYDQSRLTDEIREHYLRPVRIRGSLDGLARMINDTAGDPPIDYARITMPVLVLAAAHDRIVPLRATQTIREHIAHARVVVIERAAHLLLEERPDACESAIRAFLQDARTMPAATAPAYDTMPCRR